MSGASSVGAMRWDVVLSSGLGQPLFYEFQEVINLTGVQQVVRQEVKDILDLPVSPLPSEVSMPSNLVPE